MSGTKRLVMKAFLSLSLLREVEADIRAGASPHLTTTAPGRHVHVHFLTWVSPPATNDSRVGKELFYLWHRAQRSPSVSVCV